VTTSPGALGRRVLRSHKPRLLRLVDAADTVLDRARRRLVPANVGVGPYETSVTGRSSRDGGQRLRYGELWLPTDEIAAQMAILNTTDADEFERAGRETASQLSRLFGPGDVVMDLGCGIGRVARYVAPKCAQLWAVDASPRMLEIAQARLNDLPNVRFARCEGTTIPAMADASVNVVYAVLVLQHLEREDAFLLLRDVHRTLKLEGLAYFTFPNLLSDEYLGSFIAYSEGGEVANPVRARMYTPQEASRIVSAAGYEIIDQVDGIEIELTCRLGGR
jgi:ubiquinone/menaquinone biosynthesis C-methylase UbiE